MARNKHFLAARQRCLGASSKLRVGKDEIEKKRQEFFRRGKEVSDAVAEASKNLKPRQRITVFDDPGVVVKVEGREAIVRLDRTPRKTIRCLVTVVKPV